ncbi:MAG TPA: hypothetical protein VFW01_08730, partial [bacterium]|nr:hypothetical protein [bacterium]
PLSVSDFHPIPPPGVWLRSNGNGYLPLRTRRPVGANGEYGGSHMVRYTVTKPNGEPYHWSDVSEGWADYPIFLRRESDALDVASFLEEKFGASRVKGLDAPSTYQREKIPERMDSLDIQLALWIAESRARGEAA